MSNISVMPSSTELVVAALEAKCRLGNATDWDKAAFIAMLVGPPGRPGYGDWPYTVQEVAALGFPQMGTERTVRRYQTAWFMVRGDAPRFGEAVEMPTEEFPKAPETLRRERQEEAARARAAAGIQAAAIEVARYHNVTPNDVRASEALMKVAEFVDVRSREAARKFRSSVGDEARRMIPALYAEAGDGDVVAVNRRARSINEREWETRIFGVPRQWEQVDRMLAQVDSQLDEVVALANWLADPSNPRKDGAEVIHSRLAAIREAVWVIETQSGASSAGDSRVA